jgi:hypothetical protein
LRSRSYPPPKFFLDRGLGVYSIAEALRDAGIEIQTLRERYGEAEGQKVADEKWITEATLDGYILLHKDKRVRRRANERQALIESEARSFALSNGNLKGADAADRYLRHWTKILRAVRRHPAPFFYVVLEQGIELRRLDP